MQDRLTNIEIKIAHLENSLTELSDVLYQQQALIDRLERASSALKQQLSDAGQDPTANDPLDEKPPHY